MTVNEYLIELEEELKYLPKNKRKQLIATYRTKFNVDIDLGIPEEKITSSYKTPSEVAKEMYESEGVNYLERRKRTTKSNNIFKMILSIIGLIITCSAALILSYYMGYSVFRLFKLMFFLEGAKEIICMLLFIIPFIIVLILVYLYLVDIIILIFNFLLERFMNGLEKEYKYADFSIIDIIEEKINKKKIFKKILIASAICFVLFGFVNYFLKTYLYRSFKKVAPDKYEINEIIETDKTKLTLDIDEAKVNFIKGSNLSINIKSEFSIKSKLFLTPILSTKLSVSRIPAVSIIFNSKPSIDIIPSTVSLVVPSISDVIDTF